MKMQKGFSLVELLVTIAVVSILAVIGIVQFEEYRQKLMITEMELIFHDMVNAYEARDLDFIEDQPFGTKRQVVRGWDETEWNNGSGHGYFLSTPQEMLPGIVSIPSYFFVTAQEIKVAAGSSELQGQLSIRDCRTERGIILAYIEGRAYRWIETFVIPNQDQICR